MAGFWILIVIVVSFVVGLVTAILNRVIRKFLADDQRRGYVLLGFFVISTSIASTYFIHSIHYVGSDEVGVVEVRFGIFQKRLPPGRYLASNGEVGVQAKLLAPGLHFVPAIFATAEIHPLTEIPQGKIGIVEALDGNRLPPGSEESTEPWIDEGWYEPEKFLNNKKAFRGIQVPPLRPGKHRLHPHLFRVILVDKTARFVRFGKGEPLPSGVSNDVLPGRMEELYIRVNGTPVIANFRVNYRVTADSAYQAISKLGTKFDGKLLDLVQSTARTTAIRTLEPLNWFELLMHAHTTGLI